MAEVSVAPLTVAPLTAARFDDLVELFGPGGANSGCWCMWWRLPAKDWSARAGQAAQDPECGNKAAFERVVESGEPTGLLGYLDGRAVGWCAVAPRMAYPRLLRSRAIGPLDPDEPGVWSVTCFFIHRKHRNAGVAHALLTAAVETAIAGGASAVEGYPVDASEGRRPSGDLFTGTVGQFKRAGFTAVDGATGKRVVMRRSVG
ncbi:MAG TPA: GNAT family N-acetyltransferase [Micromonosporaceae bacterium]|jgi:GNAT superfamily N-acetyltransferase